MKDRVIDRHIRFRLFNDDLLFIWIALAPGLQGKRNENTGDFFVITDVRLYFCLCTLHHSLRDHTNLEKMIRIEVNKIHVPILAHHLELMRLRSIHVFRSEIFDRALLSLPIDQRPIDLCIFHQ
jgi:hypothetical protein